jgi:hypothetical protein
MTMDRKDALAAARHALIERHRRAIHESGHCVAALGWGVPIYRVSIEPPEMRHSLWFSTLDNSRLERLACIRLCGSAAERFFVGPVEDDAVDLKKAREYLAAAVEPSEIGPELAWLRSQAASLMRTEFARKRVPLLADSLLRAGTLTGEQVRTLCEPLHAS